jgi:DNA-binding MarR family transcriptional regulator
VPSSELEEDILAAIRRIVRAVDLRSRALVRGHQVTGPQLVTLRKVAGMGPVSVSALARAVSLSQPTVTGILHRLERAGLIRRERSERDRRSVLSTVTADGARVLKDAPSLLQDRFLQELVRLEDWERTQMLATLQRIATMMDAEDIDAAPLLTTDSFPAANEIAQSTSDFSSRADPGIDEAEEQSA